MMVRFSYRGILAGLAGVLLLAAAPVARSGTAAIKVLAEYPLHPVLRAAVDVRWGSTSLSIRLRQGGHVRGAARLRHPAAPAHRRQSQRGGFWLSSRVAASPRYLVTAAPVFAVRWRALPDGADQETFFDAIVDLDLRDDRLLILGALKDEKERFAPEGAIAWIGSLGRKLEDQKPVHYSAFGAGARPLTHCGPFDMGAARFLPDGSFLIVPPEPAPFCTILGANRAHLGHPYDRPRHRSCADMSEELQTRLAAVPEPRWAWLNRRRILDDILPLPQGPGLLVRSVSGGSVRSDLKVLASNGAIATYAVPVSSPSVLAHLSGDVRGGRLVLLLSAIGKHRPEVPPRLILAEPRSREGRDSYTCGRPKHEKV